VSAGASRKAGAATAPPAEATDVETFLAPWPGVLTEMKDFVDLWFLALGGKRQAEAVRVFISRALVAQAQLQPHAREFKAAIARIPCRIELKATGQPAHRIEIDYRR
jgi:ribosomal protein S9